LTVTQLLAPGLVTAHLGTALLLVALLSGVHQALERGRQDSVATPLWWRALILLSLLLVLGQCLLGGSLASQWAAERCLAAAEGCQWLLRHRLGATPAALAVAALVPASLALPAAERHLRAFAVVAALLVVAQVALGVTTLRLQLAVPAVTVAHQLMAALLVALLGAAAGRSLAPRSQLQGPVQAPAPALITSTDLSHG
ncbi:MAG: COX15/CtaA family protein, partial [Prochlorococcaceae cyanobacterium]